MDDPDKLVKTIIYEYTYDKKGGLKERSSQYKKDQTTKRTEKYHWHVGNIVQKDVYNWKGKLNAEYFYEYDDAINFMKNHPYYMLEPINGTANNMVSDSLIDHSGIIDRGCNPCLFRYEYDEVDRPIAQVADNWNNYLKIFYVRK